MAILSLPTSGLVYLDTGILIYSVETHADYWPLLRPLWEGARRGEITAISSELTVLETLVGPLRKGDARLAAAYDEVFHSPDLRLVAISQPILREAASLRAMVPALRTPDALHAATALVSGCASFVPNDRGFAQVPRLPFLVLDDIAGTR